MIPPTDKTGSLRSERRRDNQQWLLDRMVKTTGRARTADYPIERVEVEWEGVQIQCRTSDRHLKARHRDRIPIISDPGDGSRRLNNGNG